MRDARLRKIKSNNRHNIDHSTNFLKSGIQQKLDYFESLGVGSLWLTPIYPSPMKDNGYDIKDYNDIDPMFGNLEDFKVIISHLI